MLSTKAADRAQVELRTLPDPMSEALINSQRWATLSVLMDSMLHDARNPLNALSINLEVMAERMRRETGGLPPAYEKNIRVMREQITRVDGILRQYSDFIAPRDGVPQEADLSELTTRALSVLGHEGRKRRVALRPMIEAGVRVKAIDGSAVGFLVIQPILRGVMRAAQGTELVITVSRDRSNAILRVTDAAGDVEEQNPDLIPVLDLLSRTHHGEVKIQGGECEVILPLAAS